MHLPFEGVFAGGFSLPSPLDKAGVFAGVFLRGGVIHLYHKLLVCAIVDDKYPGSVEDFPLAHPYHKLLGRASSIPYACFQTLSSPRRGEMSIETVYSSDRTP